MSTSGLLIPEARFVQGNGKTVFVLPPGSPYVEDSTYYYERDHKGKLQCPCCDTPVHFTAASKYGSIAGSSAQGRRAHFSLFPGGEHQPGCEIEKSPVYRRPIIINKDKGFRLHINTRVYSDLFNKKSGVYGIGPSGQLEILDEDLRDREIETITSTSELVDFIDRNDVARINDSVAIFDNGKLSWDEFYIRPKASNGHARFVNLLDRLEVLKRQKLETVCAMELVLDKPAYVSYKNKTVRFEGLPILRQENGRPETIIPQVFINNFDNTYVTSAFSRAGRYLVMGVPTLWTPPKDEGRVRHHYIGIRVENPDAIHDLILNGTYERWREKAAQTAGKQPVQP